jgi:hypothetical protein
MEPASTNPSVFRLHHNNIINAPINRNHKTYSAYLITGYSDLNNEVWSVRKNIAIQ